MGWEWSAEVVSRVVDRRVDLFGRFVSTVQNDEYDEQYTCHDRDRDQRYIAWGCFPLAGAVSQVVSALASAAPIPRVTRSTSRAARVAPAVAQIVAIFADRALVAVRPCALDAAP